MLVYLHMLEDLLDELVGFPCTTDNCLQEFLERCLVEEILNAMEVNVR